MLHYNTTRYLTKGIGMQSCVIKSPLTHFDHPFLWVYLLLLSVANRHTFGQILSLNHICHTLYEGKGYFIVSTGQGVVHLSPQDVCDVKTANRRVFLLPNSMK